MNRRFGNTILKVLFAALLLSSSAAMAQRNEDPGQGQPQQNHKVIVDGNIFGGGNEENVKGSCSVRITQGGSRVNGSVYGGGAFADVNVTETVNGNNTSYSHTPHSTTTVDILAGTIIGNVYGGGLGDSIYYGGTQNIAAKVYGPVTVNIGALTGELDDQGFATTTVGSASFGPESSVYGCNNLNGTPLDSVVVNIIQTAHTQADSVPGTEHAIYQVFGGGNKANYVPASTATVKKTTVHIWTCENTIQWLYGGGNAADLGNNDTRTSDSVVIDGGRIEWVFGGGNGHSETDNHDKPYLDDDDQCTDTPPGIICPDYNPGANIFGNVNVTYHAGYITRLFGGSNEWGNISGNKNVSILNDGVCLETNHHIVELYAGNNKAPIFGNTGVTFTMPCNPGQDPCPIDYIFGGSRMANISGDVELTIKGGLYNYVFGGNNLSGVIDGNVTLNLNGGTIRQAAFGGNKGGLFEGIFYDGGSITGNITVNVADSCLCPLSVKDVFGAGDLAKYQAPTGTGAREFNPMVNVNHICPTGQTINSVTGNVYGGGNGSLDSISQRPGMVTGNPKVTIGYSNDHYAVISGKAFGGGNAAKVEGTTNVVINYTHSAVDTIFGGGNLADVTGSSNVTVLGGTVNDDVYGGGALAHVGTNASDSTIVTVLGGSAGNVYGGALGQKEGVNGALSDIAALVNGYVKVNINGGTVGNVFGCNNLNGAPQNTVVVNIDQTAASMSVDTVFGGGNLAAYGYTPDVNIINGAVSGCVYGGGNEAGVGGGDVTMTGGTVLKGLYGGCNKSGNVGGNIVVNLNSGTIGATGTGNEANVHGGGYGSSTSTSGNVEVNIAQSGATSGPTIHGDVYGGSADGSVNSNEPNSTNHTWVTLNAGTVNGSVYGGGLGITNDDCNVYGDVKVTVIGGSINTTNNTNVTSGSVFGCNNLNGAPQKTVEVIIEESTATGAPEIVVTNVYGGGNLASCSISPTVYINNGTVGGSVFGGGLGSTATVTGNPSVTVGDLNTGHTSYQAIVTNDVYGGGDLAAVEGTTTVLVQKCNSSTVTNVYGGGNAATVTNAQVYVTGGVIDTIFGGGHGTGSIAANVTNDTISITGGTIGEVFAGCNLNGSISNKMALNIDKRNAPENDDCNLYIGEAYGGGNKAAGNAGYITIGCTGDIVSDPTGHIAHPENIGSTLEGIGTVYGGANAANINNNIVVDIHNGMINKVFGGNNNSGDIIGTIQVNIDSLGACNPNWYVGEVYGGGDHALYNGTPDVNIIAGTVYRNVFGGGNDITDGTKGVTNSDVEMTGGNVLGGVYGGCNLKGTVTGNSQVKVTGGVIGTADQLADSIVAYVFGGGLGQDTRVRGDVTVTIDTANATSPTIYGDVHGGSALGQVNNDGEGKKTIVNIYGGTLNTRRTQGLSHAGLPVYIYTGGNVYGGGLGDAITLGSGHTNVEAKSFGKVIVNIGIGTLGPVGPDTAVVTNIRGDATIKGNVYGCNNVNGSPQDDVMVNIFKTAHTATDSATFVGTPPVDLTFAIANVFGGGNKADFRVSGKTATVNIYTCDNTIERTFSGGNAAATNSVRTMLQGGRIYEVYGGGNGEVTPADVHGSVILDIHGGDIWQSYAGSNQQGTIYEGSTVHVDDFGPCTETNVSEFFCGGNFADFIGDINATITCSEGMQVDNLYGGCNQANVLEGNGGHGNVTLTVWGGNYKNIYGGSKGRADDDPLGPMSADIDGNVTLNIYGGSISDAIYGGCNIKGLVYGDITVTVIDSIGDACSLDAALCDVYGGGNLAEYVAPTGNNAREFNPMVNIRHATVRNVFGGGKGDPMDNTQMKGSVTGTPKVTIGDDYDPHRAVVNESVYGGGNAAKIIGSPWVVLKSLSKVMGNVYGGGNMGVVDGDTKVIVNGKVVE